MSLTDFKSPDLQPIFRLLEIYQNHEELKFPGVSAEIIGEAAASLDEQLEEIRRLEAAVTTAREALAQKQQGLLELTKQAHAYATIFANAPSSLVVTTPTALPGDEVSKSTEAADRSARMAKLRDELASIQLENPAPARRKAMGTRGSAGSRGSAGNGSAASNGSVAGNGSAASNGSAAPEPASKVRATAAGRSDARAEESGAETEAEARESSRASVRSDHTSKASAAE